MTKGDKYFVFLLFVLVCYVIAAALDANGV